MTHLSVFVALCGILLAMSRLRHGATLRAVDSGFTAVNGALAGATSGVQQVLSFLLGVWREHVGDKFSLRAFFGALVLLLPLALLSMADIYLLSLSAEVIFHLGAESERLPLLGEVSFARAAAYTFVGVVVILSHVTLELMGVATAFHTYVQRFSPKAQRIGAWGCFGLLLVGCAVQSGAGVLRVVQQNRLSALEDMEAGFDVDWEHPADDVATAPEVPVSTSNGGFYDRLPLWVQGVFGFLLPLTVGVMGALVLDALLVNSIGLLLAVPIATVAILTWMARTALTFGGDIGEFVQNVLRIAAPRESTEEIVPAIPQLVDEVPLPESSADAAGDAPGMETPEPGPAETDSEPSGSEVDVRQAWDANPLQIPEDIWEGEKK